MQNMEPGIRPSMRAWLYTSAKGGLENSLELSETAACPPKDLLKGQILVEVLSMSLNPVVCLSFPASTRGCDSLFEI